jgi:hypothetical protein
MVIDPILPGRQDVRYAGEHHMADVEGINLLQVDLQHVPVLIDRARAHRRVEMHVDHKWPLA